MLLIIKGNFRVIVINRLVINRSSCAFVLNSRWEQRHCKKGRLKPSSNSWTGLYNTLMFFWVKARYIFDISDGLSRRFQGVYTVRQSCGEGGVRAGIISFKLRTKKVLFKLIFLRLRRRPRPLMLYFAEELQRLCCECDPAYLTNIARHRCLPRMCASLCLGLWLNR